MKLVCVAKETYLRRDMGMKEEKKKKESVLTAKMLSGQAGPVK